MSSSIRNPSESQNSHLLLPLAPTATQCYYVIVKGLETRFIIHELTLRKICHSVGFVYPKAVLGLLKSKEGENAQVTEAADGIIRSNTAKTTLCKPMKIAQAIQEGYRTRPARTRLDQQMVSVVA